MRTHARTLTAWQAQGQPMGNAGWHCWCCISQGAWMTGTSGLFSNWQQPCPRGGPSPRPLHCQGLLFYIVVWVMPPGKGCGLLITRASDGMVHGLLLLCVSVAWLRPPTKGHRQAAFRQEIHEIRNRDYCRYMQYHVSLTTCRYMRSEIEAHVQNEHIAPGYEFAGMVAIPKGGAGGGFEGMRNTKRGGGPGA
eukprot:1160090-Pelagomonas_calceolata.AAC.13